MPVESVKVCQFMMGFATQKCNVILVVTDILDGGVNPKFPRAEKQIYTNSPLRIYRQSRLSSGPKDDPKRCLEGNRETKWEDLKNLSINLKKFPVCSMYGIFTCAINLCYT